MKKGSIGAVVFLCILAGIAGGMLMGIAMAPDTIVGKAYIDTNQNRSLEYGDRPANGLKVILQKVEREGDAPAISTTTVDEVAVENGEYRFYVYEEGEYVISVVFDHSGIYQLPYNVADYIGKNRIDTQNTDETILGPTILLYRERGEKG